ncbi:MAG: twin-arginine translocase TatA/TatE family subunit [bacterium]|jgi:sec-independent protein translocase protein TatA
MGRIGPFEIALIVLVIVLLFGARRIPELMRSMGSGLREFKKGARGEMDETEGAEDKQAKTDKPSGGNNG